MKNTKFRRAVMLILSLCVIFTPVIPMFSAFAEENPKPVTIFSFDEGAEGEKLTGPIKFLSFVGAEYQSEKKFISEGSGSVKKSTYSNNANINNIAFAMNTTDLGPYTLLTLDFYITDIDVYNEYWDGHFYFQLFGENAKKESTALYSAPFPRELKEGWNELAFEINSSYYSMLSEVAAFRVCVDGSDSSFTGMWKESGAGMYRPSSKDANTVFYYDNLRASGVNPYYGADLGGETLFGFEEGSDVKYYPQSVPGHFGTTTDFRTEGGKALRRDWGARGGIYLNMFQFMHSDDSAIDLSGADVLMMDFYIGNIGVYREYWENHVYIILAECGYTLKPEESTFQVVAMPGGLQQGWNLIEINLKEINLDLSNIGAIRITPSDTWTNDWGYNPDKETTGNKADITFGVDNVRKISGGADVTAPFRGQGAVALNSATGTTIGITWPQFSDNYTLKDKIVYEVYASEEPLNSTVLADMKPGCTVTGALGGTVTGLESNTSYYFAVRAIDEAGNSSVIYSPESYSTLEFSDSRHVGILSCEEIPSEAKAPNFVANGAIYNTEIKSEGKGSISNVLQKRGMYENLLIGYRTTSPVDVTGCNVLRMDFYIDNLEHYQKFWSGRLYMLVGTSQDSCGQSDTASQYASYAIPTDLKEGWNTLEFLLDPSEIDLSAIWTIRISTASDWVNWTPFEQTDQSCELLVAFDNVYAEYISVENDKNPPKYGAGMLKNSEYTQTTVSLRWPSATDSLTVASALRYDVYLAEEKITEKNISRLSPMTSATGVNYTTVTGLIPDTEYYSAVKVCDEAGNYALISSDESFRTGKEEKDYWKMLCDCDSGGNFTIGPQYIPDTPSFDYSNRSEGTSAVFKKIDSRELWYNILLIEFSEKQDISRASRVTFDVYIEDNPSYEKYWADKYYFVLRDEYNAVAVCKIPVDVEPGWNTVSFGVYGLEVDLTAITAMRLTPANGWQNEGTPPVVNDGDSAQVTVGLDNVYATYDPDLVPTVIEKNDDTGSVIISDCDDIKEGGYWNSDVVNDMFEKTEGTASVKHVFTNTFIRSNALQYVSLEPLNLTGAEELRFDLFVSNANLLKNRAKIGVMLTNSASANEPYIIWELSLKDYLGKLQNGWNSMALPVSEASTFSFNFDWENIYMFRFYCITSNFLTGESVDIRLDNIRMVGENIGKSLPTEDEGGDDYNNSDNGYDYGFDDTVYDNSGSGGYGNMSETPVDRQNSDPIKKLTKNNVYHYLGYGAYIYILAIAVPAVIGGGIGVYLLITKLKRKKASADGGKQ